MVNSSEAKWDESRNSSQIDMIVSSGWFMRHNHFIDRKAVKTAKLIGTKNWKEHWMKPGFVFSLPYLWFYIKWKLAAYHYKYGKAFSLLYIHSFFLWMKHFKGCSVAPTVCWNNAMTLQAVPKNMAVYQPGNAIASRAINNNNKKYLRPYISLFL